MLKRQRLSVQKGEIVLQSSFSSSSSSSSTFTHFLSILNILLHPHSIRAQFGTDKKMNAVHASDGSEMAARELAFFFPKFDVPMYPEPPIQRTLALIRPEALKEHKGLCNWLCLCI